MSPPIRKPWACEGSRGNSGMARKEEGGPGGVENFAKGARWQQPLTKSPSRQQGCAPAARRRGGRSDGKVCLPSRRVSPVLTSESTRSGRETSPVALVVVFLGLVLDEVVCDVLGTPQGAAQSSAAEGKPPR